jgi:hypothetical protein
VEGDVVEITNGRADDIEHGGLSAGKGRCANITAGFLREARRVKQKTMPRVLQRIAWFLPNEL